MWRREVLWEMLIGDSADYSAARGGLLESTLAENAVASLTT